MTDSTLIFKPGFRVTDENGTPQSGATLEFYDAGTSNSRAVFTDSSLSTSAGSTVTCDSGGYPTVSDVKALLYTGATAYKIIAKKSDATTLWSHDNILGALDTSSFLTGNVTASTPVGATASNKTFVAADAGELWNFDCSGASISVTLEDAVTAGDGWRIGIRHAGTANVINIRGAGSDTIKGPGYSGASAITLRGLGETVWLSCDGSGFCVDTYVPALITRDLATIAVEGRQSAPAVSPIAGQRWILESSPSGDWSGFSENDIVEYDGVGNYIQYTPASDCGLIAYVKDEDINTQYQGSAWVDWDGVIKTLSVLHLQERQTSGTSGGTLTAGSYVTRDLNTAVVNGISGASLASSQFTLPAGTYRLLGMAVAMKIDYNRTQIYNVTDASVTLNGTTEYTNSASLITTKSFVVGTFVIASEKTFELRQRSSSSYATDGRGPPANFSQPEIYADVIIEKVI